VEQAFDFSHLVGRALDDNLLAAAREADVEVLFDEFKVLVVLAKRFIASALSAMRTRASAGSFLPSKRLPPMRSLSLLSPASVPALWCLLALGYVLNHLSRGENAYQYIIS